MPDRKEFERRLLDDATLREQLGGLADLAASARQFKEDARRTSELLRARVVSLGHDGVPKSTLARLIGVTPQRVTAMFHQAGRESVPGKFGPTVPGQPDPAGTPSTEDANA